MFSGLYDVGGWRTVHIVSVDATLSGSGGQTKIKRLTSNTHMHTDCILIVLLPLCTVWISFLSQRADIAFKTNKSSHSHSSNVWVFVHQQNIAKCVSSAWGARFKSAVSSQDRHVIGAGVKHDVLKPSQLPVYNHLLHRFLSVVTHVGHPSHGADLLVRPSAGERWLFLRMYCSS